MLKTLFGKADLHIHSRYSQDAVSSVRVILKRAKARGLDLVSITDHDTIKGAREAKKIAQDFGIEFVVGEEISTQGGDLIGIFIEEEIRPKRRILETIKEIHNQGGLAIIPHPDNWFLGGIPVKVLLEIFTQADGIELFNGSWVGKISRKKIKNLNKTVFNLASIGSSDAHLSRQVGCSYTLFPGKSAKDLYRAIKERLTTAQGRSWSYKDRFVWTFCLPGIIYKNPVLPFQVIQRVVKKVL